MTQAAQLTDFSDRLSPMVVKELRQGLRNRRFVLTMLSLHLLLSLLTFALVGGDQHGTVKGIMTFLVIVVLLIILPLSGSGALASEINGGTLEMLTLSRLSAWRIVAGKWAAIVLQTLLLIVSLLPYQVATYLHGETELGEAVIYLGYLWLISAVLTAAAIALSSLRHGWVRLIFIGIPLFMTGLGSMNYFFSVLTSRSSSSLHALQLEAVFRGLMVSGWLVFTCLSTAALRIAPAASMLPTVMRLVNGLTLIALGLSAWLTSEPQAFMPWLTAVLGVTFIAAFSEPDRTLPSQYTPFYRLPWPFRSVVWLLAPGWSHGWLFTLLLTALTMALTQWVSINSHAWESIWMLATSFWLIGLLARIMDYRKQGNRFILLMLAGVFLAATSLLLGAVPRVSREPESLRWILTLLPTTYSSLPPPLNIVGLAIAAFWPVLLWPAFVKVLRMNQPAREGARQIIKP